MKIVSIVGARPQFIKLAPLAKAIKEEYRNLKHVVIHTGQHYDHDMSHIFFDELGIPEPNYHLGVGSGTHAIQTAGMLMGIEKALLEIKPDLVIIFGDTNSTLAGALAATKLHIAVAHVEAGLRSYNRRMPEEINRVLSDRCSQLLLCPTKNAIENLVKEGFNNYVYEKNLIPLNKDVPISSLSESIVINVGDIMYDALDCSLSIAQQNKSLFNRLGLERKKYYLATIHRSENTDNVEYLESIIKGMKEVSKNYPVLWPLHPRTKKYLDQSGFEIKSDRINMIEPVGYYDMLLLEKEARIVLTDSGGVQKEAYFQRVPCITLRSETEWVETVEDGMNILAGSNIQKITSALDYFESQDVKAFGLMDAFGDGNAALRIAQAINKYLNLSI